MNLRELHPFYRWWKDQSGWGDSVPDGTLMAEGNLAAAAWNAALDAAAKMAAEHVNDGCPEPVQDAILALGYVAK